MENQMKEILDLISMLNFKATKLQMDIRSGTTMHPMLEIPEAEVPNTGEMSGTTMPNQTIDPLEQRGVAVMVNGGVDTLTKQQQQAITAAPENTQQNIAFAEQQRVNQQLEVNHHSAPVIQMTQQEFAGKVSELYGKNPQALTAITQAGYESVFTVPADQYQTIIAQIEGLDNGIA